MSVNTGINTYREPRTQAIHSIQRAVGARTARRRARPPRSGGPWGLAAAGRDTRRRRPPAPCCRTASAGAGRCPGGVDAERHDREQQVDDSDPEVLGAGGAEFEGYGHGRGSGAYIYQRPYSLGNQSVGSSRFTLTLNCRNTMPLTDSSAIRAPVSRSTACTGK